MAMPQRDDLIEEIKRTDLLLEWAVNRPAQDRRKDPGGLFRRGRTDSLRVVRIGHD